MTYQTQDKESFRRRLLAADAENPALRAEYERRLQAMWEPRLSLSQRVAWSATGLLGLGFTVWFGYWAIRAPETFPILLRVGFALGALFGLAWAVFAYGIVRRGTTRLKTDPMAAAGMGWVFVVVTLTIFMVAGSASRELWAVKIVVNGLFFVIAAATILLRTVIEQAEMRTQERIVELEYKIARLSEKLGGDDDLLGTGVR